MEAAAGLLGPGAVDAQKQEDLRKAALDCLRKTISFVWSTVHYPPGNKAIADSAAAWKDSLSRVLTMRNSFLLALLKTRLYFEDTLLDTHDDMSKRFVKEMIDRRIKKIIFWRGVSEKELERFSVIMSGKAKELLEKGGPLAVLKKQRVKNIEIVENEYQEENEDEEQLEYWERKLKKLGLNKQEIVDFMCGRRSLPRLLTDELRLLVEAMKDPLFLSQIIVRIAMMESGGRSTAPRELFRISNRVQYILLANSLFDPKETPRVLTRAAKAFEPRLRRELLAEKIRLEASGVESIDDRTFAFSPDEYADHIVRDFERRGEWPASIDTLYCSPAEAAAVGQALRARLMTSPAWDGDNAQTEAQIRALLPRLYCPLPVNGTPATDITSLSSPDAQTASDALRHAGETLPQDLGDGYVHGLLSLLAVTHNNERAEDIFHRLVDFLILRLDTEAMADALRLLPMIFDPEVGERRLKWLKHQFRETLDLAHRDQLAAGVVSELMVGNEEALEPANVMSDIFGQEFRQGVVSAFFEQAEGGPSAALLQFLSRFETELLPVLKNYLTAKNSMTRVRAIELLAAFDSKLAQDMVAAGLRDPDRYVRLVTLFTLGRGSGPQGIAGLTNVASKGGRAHGALMERCAAVNSLGKLKQKHSLNVLERIITKRNWVRRRKGWELKACAALALKEMGTIEALEILKKHVATMHLTRLDLIIAWIDARFRVVVRVVKMVIGTAVQAVVAVYRAIVWILMLPVRLATLALRGIASLLRIGSAKAKED